MSRIRAADFAQSGSRKFFHFHSDPLMHGSFMQNTIEILAPGFSQLRKPLSREMRFTDPCERRFRHYDTSDLPGRIGESGDRRMTAINP